MDSEKIWVLLEHIDVIDKARGSIVLRWISDGDVAQILERHGIEQLYFADTYAHAVLGYYIDVVTGEQQIGDCPVIAKLLDFLKEKEVSADELFVICTHFRKSMIEELFAQGRMDAKLYDAVSYVFDNNFAGVLKAYTTTIYHAQQETKVQQQMLEQYGIAMDESNLVSRTDLEGTITYVNKKFEEVSGYSEEELMGHSHNLVRHPDQPSEFYKELWDTVKAGKIFKNIIKNRAKDGSVYYVDATIMPIFDIDGNIIEYLAVRHNVTDLVEARDKALKAEKAKDQFLANMSHELRTPLNAILGFVQLLQKRLSNDEKSLHYLDIVFNSSQSLLAIIGDILDLAKIQNGTMQLHERSFNIGQTLKGAVEHYSKSAEDQEIEYLAYIDPMLPVEAVGDPMRIKQIISHFLSNALKFTPEGGSVEVTALLDRNTLEISVQDSGSGIPEDLQERIFTAFEQAENSDTRRFGGTGLGLSIAAKLAAMMGGTIALESTLGKGSTFTLKVPLKKIVVGAPAYHCSASKVYLYAGTQQRGIGRCFQRYADAMCHGWLHVSDTLELEEGATLIIGTDELEETQLDALKAKDVKVLLLAKNSNAPMLQRPDILSLIAPFDAEAISHFFDIGGLGDDSAAESGFCGHVLVVEDNRANQQLITILLEESGLSCEVAENGSVAVEKYKSGQYDLILMDQQMPVMNGVEATAAILSYEKASGLKHTPIVALTANVLKGDREYYLQNGMDDYLKKPIDQAELSATLAKYLEPKNNSEKRELMNIPNYSNLDAEAMAQKIGLRAKHIPILVNSYLDESKTILSALKAAVETLDFEEIQQQAHSIKGSSGNLKFDELYEMAKSMELAANAKDETFDYAGVYAVLEAGIATISL